MAPMRARITVITLAVDDLERAYRFYHDGLGLASEGIVGREFEHGAVAFFDLQAGLKLALWPRTSLAADTGLALDPVSATELALVAESAPPGDSDGYMMSALSWVWLRPIKCPSSWAISFCLLIRERSPTQSPEHSAILGLSITMAPWMPWSFELTTVVCPAVLTLKGQGFWKKITLARISVGCVIAPA